MIRDVVAAAIMVLIAISACAVVLQVDKPRSRIRSGEAAMNVVISSLLILGVWYLHKGG